METPLPPQTSRLPNQNASTVSVDPLYVPNSLLNVELVVATLLLPRPSRHPNPPETCLFDSVVAEQVENLVRVQGLAKSSDASSG